jgi:threonine synthase
MSEVQRRQMTTVDSPNVFTLRVNGNFDDCQNIVKEAFNERSFLKKDQFLLAVNSINWVRIIGQICYYFYASLKISKFEEPINFSVPTGNFGNVFACYSAHKMGMPLGKILVAVNNNNILHRFFSNNDYSRSEVSETISPSMDISIASNFERLIYDFYAERDSDLCRTLYKSFLLSSIELDRNLWEKTEDLFLELLC